MRAREMEMEHPSSYTPHPILPWMQKEAQSNDANPQTTQLLHANLDDDAFIGASLRI